MSWYQICKAKNIQLSRNFYSSVDEIDPVEWNAVLGNNNLYLSIDYLRALEASMSEVIQFRYFLLYNSILKPVAIGYVQIVDFNNDVFKTNKAFCQVFTSLKNRVLESIDVKMMVCGNIFTCGENGFYYTSAISSEEAFDNLSATLYELREMEKGPKPVSVVLMKEFFPDSFDESDKLKLAGFKDFKIDVNMILRIHPEWKSMDDYLFSMTTKFRTKAKGVYKKSADLEVRSLTAEEIKTNLPAIEKLYQNVVDKAEFRFGRLSADAFISYKTNLGDHFIFNGYFLHSNLVGFSTAFFNDRYIDANYVGLDYSVNQSYAVYQRMLYDYVQLSVERGVQELRLGRTAEEIKSCIGAEPCDMKLYIRHRNSISNHFIAHIISAISPNEFELRYPFKAGFNQPAL